MDAEIQITIDSIRAYVPSSVSRLLAEHPDQIESIAEALQAIFSETITLIDSARRNASVPSPSANPSLSKDAETASGIAVNDAEDEQCESIREMAENALDFLKEVPQLPAAGTSNRDQSPRDRTTSIANDASDQPSPAGSAVHGTRTVQPGDTDGQDSGASANDDENQTQRSPCRETRAQRSSETKGTRSHRRLRGKKLGNPVKTATTPRGQKRKASIRANEEKPNKFSKTHKDHEIKSYKSTVSQFFKNLAPIPESLKQPFIVYQTLVERSQSGNHESIWLLTRLIFAVGSPDAFCQLRDACVANRNGGDLPVPQSSEGVSQTVQALDKLDLADTRTSILRRYYLASLMIHRQQQEDHRKSLKPERVRTKSKYNKTHQGQIIDGQDDHIFNRSDSQALTDLMAQAYPGLKPSRKRRVAADDEYQKRLQSLKDRLRAGRNWCKLQERLGTGVLALVPTKGDFKVQNYEVERLSASLFSTFLNVLDELRGEFLRSVSERIATNIPGILRGSDLNRRYIFESMEGKILKQEPLDSSRFVELCELEDASSAS